MTSDMFEGLEPVLEDSQAYIEEQRPQSERDDSTSSGELKSRVQQPKSKFGGIEKDCESNVSLGNRSRRSRIGSEHEQEEQSQTRHRSHRSRVIDDYKKQKDEYETSRHTSFRFKRSGRDSGRKEDERFEPGRQRPLPADREKRHSSKRRKTSKRHNDPTSNGSKNAPENPEAGDIDPEVAFRESLFEAMADDEGAAFWEGVYGQPIPFEKVDTVKEAPTGKLESMTEEEYAAHIREEMYKKTHQHLLEEKAIRDRAKMENERLAKQRRREAQKAERFNQQVEESLRRGTERKRRQKMAAEWTQRWISYEKSWEDLGKTGTKIPWPVWKGDRSELDRQEIEKFFLNAPTAGDVEKADLLKILKAERVRWHPDKVQQKLGGQAADKAQIEGVTAVFQIIDRMWAELRDKK